VKERKSLLQSLKDIQLTYGYIPEESIRDLSGTYGLSETEIYSVISFYGMLSTEKKAKYAIKVCNSLPCKVNKSSSLVDVMRQILHIEPGQTTADGLFSLEIVSCLGLCDQSPVILINEEVYGKLTAKKLVKLLSSLQDNEN